MPTSLFTKFAKKCWNHGRLALLLPAIVLAGCSTETLNDSTSFDPGIMSGIGQHSLLMAKPIETYTFTARMVHRCWLNPQAPLVPDHVFFATASRKGGEKAHIGIHQRAELGRKGKTSFVISFLTDGIGTTISTKNYRLEPALAERMKQDVSRWTGGDATCPPPAGLAGALAGNEIPAALPEQAKKKNGKKK